MFFVTFPYSILGGVSIPDLCLLPYFPLGAITNHFGSLISPYALNVDISILTGAHDIFTSLICSQFNNLDARVKFISYLHCAFVESKDLDEPARMHM